MRVVFEKIRNFIKYEKRDFQEKRELGLLADWDWELPILFIILIITIGITIFCIIDIRQIEKNYKNQILELDRYYKEKELNRNSHREKYYSTDEFDNRLRNELESDHEPIR